MGGSFICFLNRIKESSGTKHFLFRVLSCAMWKLLEYFMQPLCMAIWIPEDSAHQSVLKMANELEVSRILSHILKDVSVIDGDPP